MGVKISRRLGRMLNSYRLQEIPHIGMVSILTDIFLSKAFRAIVLISWVAVSVLVLSSISVSFIMQGPIEKTIFGMISLLFSLVPVFVYIDIKKSNGQ